MNSLFLGSCHSPGTDWHLVPVFCINSIPGIYTWRGDYFLTTAARTYIAVVFFFCVCVFWNAIHTKKPFWDLQGKTWRFCGISHTKERGLLHRLGDMYEDGAFRRRTWNKTRGIVYTTRYTGRGRSMQGTNMTLHAPTVPGELITAEHITGVHS